MTRDQFFARYIRMTAAAVIPCPRDYLLLRDQERRREVLAAPTKALANELQGLQEACKVLGKQAAEAGYAVKDLRLELDPEAPGGS